MKQVFCHAATFARIAGRLKRFDAELAPVVMNDAGETHWPWGEAGHASAPMIAYGTQDAYFSKAAPAFFKTVFAAPRLVWFQSSAAGIEHPMLRAVGTKAGVFTRSHEQSAAIAEWVLWAGLDHFQGGPARRAAQARGDWQRDGFREISDTRWLIVGFGHIGRATAQRLRVLGAHVTGCRRSPGDDLDADEMITPDALTGALGRADAVLLCLPLTAQTEQLASAAFFAAMAPGALFLNVGRGASVDEAALLAGLDAGRPGRAALDVTTQEPPEPDNAFWSHPQVTLTAHIAAKTKAAQRRTDALFLANLERFLSGGDLEHTVPAADFATDV